jgi:hypothetical protein
VDREIEPVSVAQRMAIFLVGLAVAALGPACTSAPKAGAAGGIGAADAPEACFNARNVDSFSPLHARFVYVRLLGDEQYLLTLDTLYVGLPYATGIRISSSFSRVCSGTGAMITFRDAGRPVRCRIVRVEAVASREAAQQLVTDRTPSR